MGLHFAVSESKMAPEGHKETARQHPRSNPLTPEKQTLHGSIREQPTVPRQGKDKQNHSSASDTSNNNKTFTSTVTEKLAPAYNAVSDATTAITSKIQNISVGGGPAQSPSPAQASSSPASSPTTTEQSPKFYDAPVSSSAPEKCPEGAGEETSPGKQIWEKGVSMKEYLMQKLEPGDDERALSQVISDAISPKRAPGAAGVVGKVKEAVTSLLRKDDSSTLWKSSSSQDPASSSLREEGTKDKSHGRVFQTN
ncbi:hypothetical protein SAY87_013537 [Trapa incisa]|uniref:LTI65/LTI78 PGEED repeat domain-containing protein n=1 Tax=Trapa incisa TaxID=236973 RepID=A0AAN7KF80_9MYRT|nr:hypothetical protein SAY87_013537 [Trapa incisa]